MGLPRLLGIGLAVLVTSGAEPAHACLTLPAPPWSRILTPGGPDVLIGRIVHIEVADEPRVYPDMEVVQETATISLLQTIQGSADPEYIFTQPHSWRNTTDRIGCGLWKIDLEVGDLIVGYEDPNGTLAVVRPEDVPASIQEVIETLR